MRDYYPDPVHGLLSLGEPTMRDWLDYGRLGIGPEHLNELIRLASNVRLDALEDDEDPRVWAPLHAMRAIAELADERAMEPLLAIATARHYRLDVVEALIDGLSLCGPDAVAACGEYLRNPGHPDSVRWAVAEAVELIGTHHPEASDRCADALAGPLMDHQWVDPTFAGFPLLCLAGLGATQYLPLAQELHEAGLLTDKEFASWDDVVEAFESDEYQAARPVTVEGETWPRRAPTYRLRVTLREIEPPIWREIEVPGDVSLCRLHHVVQQAFGWWTYHLYEFHTGDGLVVDLSVFEEVPPATRDALEVRLSDVAPEPPATIVYVYDMGDEWVHEIDVVEVLETGADPGLLPRCTAGARSAPREDCGGTDGYEALLEALADPTHPEHHAMVEWSDDHDPEHFDLDEINRRMRGTDWRDSSR